MPQRPADRVYEVWVERARRGRPDRCAVHGLKRGSASVDVPGDLRDAQAVMVTAEPLGGSRKPTSAPVILARLS